MAQDTGRQTFWTTARQGWKLSVVVGLAVLLIRFKALIPLVWQMLVQNGTAHTIGTALSRLLTLAVIVGGLVVFAYAVRTGYRRASRELAAELTGSPAGSTVALRVVARVSWYVNAPVLYWALFLFVLLPQLLKIPNASLRIGTTAALAGAFISMAAIVLLATHIGLWLTRSSFRSITTRAPGPLPASYGSEAVIVGSGEPLAYAPQGAYPSQAVYPLSPLPMPSANGQAPYGQPGNPYLPVPSAGSPAPSQQLPYVQPPRSPR